MIPIIPPKLKPGDLVSIIAPSRSLAIINQETREIANQRFADLGLKLTFGAHTEEIDDFASSSIESRVADLHEAFTNPEVKAIITVIGGFNSNQLLRSLDWDLIKNNPKIFCGYSDITTLSNAIFAKTGLVTYSGPHYSTFGQKLHFDYTFEYFKKCLFSEEPFTLSPSKEWSDDLWFLNQDDRTLLENPGWKVINEGKAEGIILGANLGTFRLLQGTEYMHSLDGSVLFLEDTSESKAHDIDRELQSLIHLPDFKGVKGLVFGRFQKESKIDDNLLNQIIKSKKELDHIPVISGVDFGHTNPMVTFPIGGEVSLSAKNGEAAIRITTH